MSPTCRIILLFALGLALTLTAVPSVFTTDENQYTSYANAIRQGELHLPGTRDLPPALGLAYFEPFDPAPRPVPPSLQNPLKFRVAPLHAILTAPLVPLGWYALVAVNAFSFCVALALVFLFTRRWSQSLSAPWLAAIAFGLGTHALEYAQGVWPHTLSLALVLGSFYLAAIYRDMGRWHLALFAGLLAGAAFGVRNQSLLFIPLIGGGVLLLAGQKRWRGALAFALGTLPVLILYSLINHHVSDSWLPLSRGVSYFQTGGGGQGYSTSLEWLLAFWTKVVDFSHHPAMGALKLSYMLKDPTSGAIVIVGAIKKAWLQSSPWIAIALVGLLAAWRPNPNKEADGRSRELRAISLLVFPVLIAISLKGFSYGDGLSFNQRYFLELTPLAAIALALILDRLDVLGRRFFIALLFSAIVFWMGWTFIPRYLLLGITMQVPLLLGLVALFGWFLAKSERAPVALPIAVGACIAWALVAHVFDDVAASRRLRSQNLARQQALDPILVDGTAVFAYWGAKDPYGPLQLDRDLLIIDSAPDEPRTLRRLMGALLDQGRRVYVIPRMPQEKLIAMTEGFELSDRRAIPVPHSNRPTYLVEVTRPEARPNPSLAGDRAEP